MKDPSSTPDFASVTETAKTPISRDAVAMMYSRYRWARDQSSGRRLLEIGCGSGQGLAYLSEVASLTCGTDYYIPLVREARTAAPSTVPVLAVDAHRLPFADSSFDVVLLFEMIYYLRDFAQVLLECHRVLADDGVVLICSANPEPRGFNPSPYSERYYTVDQLKEALQAAGYVAETFAAFEVKTSGLRAKMFGLARRIVAGTRVVPKTMKGKTLVKRIVYGKLQVVPAVTEGIARYEEPRRVVDVRSFQVIYARGQKE